MVRVVAQGSSCFLFDVPHWMIRMCQTITIVFVLQLENTSNHPSSMWTKDRNSFPFNSPQLTHSFKMHWAEVKCYSWDVVLYVCTISLLCFTSIDLHNTDHRYTSQLVLDRSTYSNVCRSFLCENMSSTEKNVLKFGSVSVGHDAQHQPTTPNHNGKLIAGTKHYKCKRVWCAHRCHSDAHFRTLNSYFICKSHAERYTIFIVIDIMFPNTDSLQMETRNQGRGHTWLCVSFILSIWHCQ